MKLRKCAFLLLAGLLIQWMSPAWADECCLALPLPTKNPTTIPNEADGWVHVTFGGSSLFSVILSDPPSPLAEGTYGGWCVDAQTGIEPDEVLGSGYTAQLYSTCDPSLPFREFLPPLPPPPTPPANPHSNLKNVNAAQWKMLNYLLNHRSPCNGETPTMWEVQLAVFLILGQTPPEYPHANRPADPEYPDYRESVVTCLFKRAEDNAPTWNLKCGDKVAVIFLITNNWIFPEIDPEEDLQILIIEVPWCPEITVTCPANVTIECGGDTNPDTNPSLGKPTTGLACCPLTTSYDDQTDASNPCNKVITRTWTYSNACVKGTCVQIITVKDTKPPVITGLGGPLEIECGAALVFSDPKASDCSGVKSFDYTEKTELGKCRGNYSVTRTWTAVDNCGLTSSASQTITVKDTKKPEIVGVGGDFTIECPAEPKFSEPQFFDCTLEKWGFEDVTTPGPCVTTITRTWTTVDSCGNESSDSQTITIKDTKPPAITGVGSSFSIKCGEAFKFSDPKASDDCALESFTFKDDEPKPGRCAGEYSVTRTWTATDKCGLITQASQTITVIDTDPPVFGPVSDIVVKCDVKPTVEPPSATDCGVSVTVTGVRSDGKLITDPYPPGTTTITWTAKDSCDNIATKVQLVTVEPGFCEEGKFWFSGSSSANGKAGYSKTFTADNGVTVTVTAFSRTKGSAGTWNTAYLGAYNGGLGVTDGSEDGGNNSHTVDNVGQDNYLLFKFSDQVIVDTACVGYVVTDSDMTFWIGDVAGSTLSEAILSGLATETSLIDNGSTRCASFNASKKVGNALIIAAWPGDTSPDDKFKVQVLKFCKPTCTPPKSAIGNRVWYDKDKDGIQDSDEDGVSGVTVKLLNCDGTTELGSTTTDSGGYYAFTGLTPGSYRIKVVVPAGYIVSPKDVGSNDERDSDGDTSGPTIGLMACTTLTPGETDNSWDLGIYKTPPPQPACIGNFVWKDKNGNGTQDYGESGVENIKVELYTCAGVLVATTQTGYDGSYSFTVAPGDYYVKFSNLPGGYVFSPSTPSTASDPNDNDADPTTGKTGCTNLTAGETDPSWDAGIYKPTVCASSTVFGFGGSSSLDGDDGNVRTFTSGGVTVRATAFSRNKSTGQWYKAYLGAYGGGLGVTDPSEGNGGNNSHTVDNIDRDNYVLFEFSQQVILSAVSVGYVVKDSDMTVKIGTFTDPYNNHLILSDSVLSAFGFSEDNATDSSSPRTANVNSGQITGNAIVVAALLGDASPEDQFKICALDICIPAGSTPPPPPWQGCDVGSCKPGSHSCEANCYTVKGSGADIWGTSDACRYVYQPANGDCTIIARVTGVENTDPWAKAGIMIRETLNANSKHVSAFLTPGNGCAFQYRKETGGTSGNSNTTGINGPCWVKIVRSGNTFTAYRLPNGGTWTEIGKINVTMGNSCYIGLAVTSHNSSAICTATFDNITANP